MKPTVLPLVCRWRNVWRPKGEPGQSIARENMEYGFNQKIKIVGVTEALGLSAVELAGWNVLSIRARMNEMPLNFPGAHRTLTLHFDDVLADCAEDGEYAATPAYTGRLS